MPELPEVETVVRGLRDLIQGHAFARVDSFAPAASIIVSPTLPGSTLGELLPGRTVRDVTRRGKNILISLSGGLTLRVHLKMTGRFRFVPAGEPREKHDLVQFDFIHPSGEEEGRLAGGMQMRFHDYRRFGRLRLSPDPELWDQPGLADLGPEPLELKVDDFVNLCLGRRRMIKPALLDQRFIAGIGNIYADEALFLSRIHPARRTDSVSRPKLAELHRHLQELLTRSIEYTGTTIINFAGVGGGEWFFPGTAEGVWPGGGAMSPVRVFRQADPDRIAIIPYLPALPEAA